MRQNSKDLGQLTHLVILENVPSASIFVYIIMSILSPHGELLKSAGK